MYFSRKEYLEMFHEYIKKSEIHIKHVSSFAKEEVFK